MKGMADSLHNLGWPVEDRILVLNVLHGLSDRYAHIRTWITRQRSFPTFLQVCDDLVMEELSQGITPALGLSPLWGPRPPRLPLLLLYHRVHPLRRRHLFWVLSPPGSSEGRGAVVAAVTAEGDVVGV
jgi:hypothetical protein